MPSILASLSPEESLRREKRLDYLSAHMNEIHEYFKSEFNSLYELADGSYNKYGMSLSLFLSRGQSLIDHLTKHHTIEERYFFPKLAGRMPQFASGSEHLKSHQGIHDGLDSLESLIHEWSKDNTQYSPEKLRECLDGFREVLFHHLDEEVADLRGENLLKYFTEKEIESLS
ncbi:hemerythrin HHE cation binding domain-containing protein [Coprinopsis sp. MPI-PUGE-AT-0042]|nr:hemerythrin HHE cation binding domain-containing protein [Coprinopsis sp. MPI-PUGE-AT-0042]